MHPPPRRESRLHKAVLTLLVAASAAFFVCAQASSATFIPDDDPENNIGAVKAITNVTIWHTSNVVAGEQFTLKASTDQPFHTVEWFLGDSEVPIATATSDYEGDQYASRGYTFQSGQGSSDEAGRRHAIKAVAYPLEPDDPRNNGLTATSDERPVFVHEGKGKLLYYVDADIYGFDLLDMETGECAVYWVHGISYYNDFAGAEARMYAYIKVHRVRTNRNGEPQEPDRNKDPDVANFHVTGKDGSGNGEEIIHDPYSVDLELKYRGYIFQDFDMTFTKFQRRKHYYAQAETRLETVDIDDIDWAERREGVVEGKSTDVFMTSVREFKNDWVEGWNSY